MERSVPYKHVSRYIYIGLVFVYGILMTIITGKRKWQKLHRKFILLMISCLLSVYILSKYSPTPRFSFVNKNVYGRCIIPHLDPFDKSIKEFEWHPDAIKCENSPTLVFVNNDGYLQYNESTVKQMRRQGVTCTYSVVSRHKGNDDYVDFGPAIHLVGPVKVTGDFFRVICKDSNARIVYDVMHSQIDSKAVLENRQIKSETNDQFSMFIFGVDGVSRLAATRKLPKTIAYLRDELAAFAFKGHMKVADNTFPNVVAMLTGKKAYSDELPNEGNLTTVHFDTYPFIWTALAKTGYTTMFLEDYAELNMFNLNKAGFIEQPTDHYMRPYWQGVKKTNWRGVKRMDLMERMANSAMMGFNGGNLNLKNTSILCYRNTPKHIISLKYIVEFIKRYREKLRFSFTWLNDISHDNINLLELGDTDFRDFFKWINEQGHIDNAFVIFISDHGSRIDRIRNTYVGRIEERMPLLQIAVPKKLRDRYPRMVKNMQDNTERLTTHYDFHQTLVDIMNSNFQPYQANNVSPPRGISLFSPIPEVRSCAQAGVPEHYCACYRSEEVPLTEPLITKMAEFVVEHINSVLSRHSDLCEKLVLNRIKHAERIELALKANGNVEFFSLRQFFEEPENPTEERYLVLLETIPGKALLEATVLVDNHKRFSTLGQVSRTNAYGTQSHCVKDDSMRLYCLCKQSPP